jgi:hypothetical protein
MIQRHVVTAEPGTRCSPAGRCLSPGRKADSSFSQQQGAFHGSGKHPGQKWSGASTLHITFIVAPAVTTLPHYLPIATNQFGLDADGFMPGKKFGFCLR